MHELFALSKLSLLQFRWVYWTFLALVVGSPLLAMINPLITSGKYVDSLIGIWLSLAVAAGFAGVTLFDFTHRGDLNSPQSGCSHWLLRMPVPSWKIALTPIVLKTAWYVILWGIVAVIVSLNNFEPVPVIGPMLCFSGGAIGLMAISWMPYRKGWHRIVLVPFVLITVYLLFCVIAVAPHTHPQWRFAINVSGPVLSVVFYLLCVGAVFWATSVSRTATLGLTSEEQPHRWWSYSTISHEATAPDHIQTYHYAGHALAWHEFYRTRSWAVRALAIGILPAILFFGVLFPVNTATVVMAFLVFAYVAAFAVGGAGDMAANASGTTFQTYLLVSPLSTARLAWTRFAVRISIAASVYSTIVVAFAFAALWPANRTAWSNWATQIAFKVDADATPMSIGICVSVAITLIASVFLMGQIASHWWFSLSGSSRLSLTVIFIELTLIFVPLSMFLYWFIRQRNWIEVQAAFATAATFLPTLAAGLIVFKITAVVGAVILLLHHRLCEFKTVLQIVAIWATFVGIIGTVVSALLPLPYATFLACVSGIAILTPLARILIMPVLLAHGRHR